MIVEYLFSVYKQLVEVEDLKVGVNVSHATIDGNVWTSIDNTNLNFVQLIDSINTVKTYHSLKITSDATAISDVLFTNLNLTSAFNNMKNGLLDLFAWFDTTAVDDNANLKKPFSYLGFKTEESTKILTNLADLSSLLSVLTVADVGLSTFSAYLAVEETHLHYLSNNLELLLDNENEISVNKNSILTIVDDISSILSSVSSLSSAITTVTDSSGTWLRIIILTGSAFIAKAVNFSPMVGVLIGFLIMKYLIS